MKTPETVPNTLSDEMNQFCLQLLSEIFVEGRKGITGFGEEECEAVCILLKGLNEWTIKEGILEALAPIQRVALLPYFDPQFLNALFSHMVNPALAQSLFRKIQPTLQHLILSEVYTSNRKLYGGLRELSRERIRVVNGIQIRQQNLPRSFYEAEVEAILDSILSPSTSQEDLRAKAKIIQKSRGQDELDQIVSKLIQGFSKLKITLTNAENFGQVLKFYGFLDVFVKENPWLEAALRPYIEDFILTLKDMNSAQWRYKVLGQLPDSIIRMVLVALGSLTTTDLTKRNASLFVLRDLQDHMDLPEAEAVKAIWTRL